MSKGGEVARIRRKQLTKLLQALSREDRFLARTKTAGDQDAAYRLCNGPLAQQHSSLRPPPALVDHCLQSNLLIRTGRGIELSPVGLLALRRMLASDDPFARQHQERKIQSRKVHDEVRDVVVNDRSTPLGWLAKRTDSAGRPMISRTQFAAGERLARDFLFADMNPRITSSWSGLGSGMGIGGPRRGAAGVEMADNKIAARQRVRTAINEVGSDLADILLDICCFQLGLSEAEKTRGWPRRSGKVILQIALDRLALHYGMMSPDRDNGTRGEISHWGAKGYKPQ